MREVFRCGDARRLGLKNFDHVHLFEQKAGLLWDAAHRRHWADPHDARLDPGRRYRDQRRGGEVIDAHRSQRAAVAADRRAHGVTNKG
jgi:hypothetical protein